MSVLHFTFSKTIIFNFYISIFYPLANYSEFQLLHQENIHEKALSVKLPTISQVSLAFSYLDLLQKARHRLQSFYEIITKMQHLVLNLKSNIFKNSFSVVP